jgi:predicted porin
MNKKLIAAAVAAVFAAPMAASADATIYGAIDTAIGFNDIEGAGAVVQDNVTVDGIDGALGIKGSEDLGNGLKAIYKIETNFAGDNGKIGGSDGDYAFEMDEVWVGRSSNWGTAAIGREDHPYKNAINATGYNPFGDKILDMDANSSLVGGRAFRQQTADNAILYISPNISGFSFQGALVAPEGNGLSGADSDGINKGFDAYSLGANFTLGGLKLGAGYEDIDVSKDEKDVRAYFVAGSYAIGGFTLGAAYEQTKDDNVSLSGLTGDSSDRYSYKKGSSFGLSGTYTFGNNVIGANYVAEEQKDPTGAGSPSSIPVDLGSKIKIDSWGLDFSHNLSNRTQVYAAYAEAEHKGDVTKAEDKRFALGVVHSF